MPKNKKGQADEQTLTAPKAHAKMADNSSNSVDVELNESFLDIAFDEVPEMTTAEDGEYEIMCERARLGASSKEGNEKYAMLYLNIPSEPTVKTFTQIYMLGKADDSENTRFRKLNDFREAATAFGVSVASGVNMDDFAGQTAWGTVGTKEDPQYGVQNILRGKLKAGR